MTVADATRRFDVSRQTISKRMMDGQLQTVKHRLYRPVVLDDKVIEDIATKMKSLK